MAKDVERCTYYCYVRCAILIVWLGWMPCPQINASQCHAQLGLPDRGRAMKGLAVCNVLDQEPLDPLNGLALGCYQPYHEVWIVFPYQLIKGTGLRKTNLRSVGITALQLKNYTGIYLTKLSMKLLKC